MDQLLNLNLTLTPQMLSYLGLGLFGVGLAAIIIVLGSAQLSVPAALGLRGWKRQQAVAESESFRMLDPAVRLMATWISLLPIHGARAKASSDSLLC